MADYDFVIVGAGAAGLSLAYHLLQSPLRERSILIVERDAKERNDRTWCYWTAQPTLFAPIVYRSWDHIHFEGEGFASTIALGDYRYEMIRGIDFYRFARHELGVSGNVDYIQGSVERIDDADDRAYVAVGERCYSGRWVFDSRFCPAELRTGISRYHLLQQYFTGWEIETSAPVFDPSAATLLDFRVDQRQSMRFVYVLPFSERHALVEYVSLCPDDAAATLRGYLGTILGVTGYRIVAEEHGINPLTDRPFARRRGRQLMAIGAHGGRIKPTSGYAFMRIQHDSAAIVRSLVRLDHPFDVPRTPWRYALCDTLLLDLMERQGQQIKPIFTALFRRNPIKRVLRFLDEAGTPWENLALIATLPPRVFLATLFRLKMLHRL